MYTNVLPNNEYNYANSIFDPKWLKAINVEYIAR